MFSILPIILIVIVGSKNLAKANESKLFEKLFANYSRSSRPLRNGLNSVNVTVGSIRLRGIEDYDEMTATLSLLGWLIIVSGSFI